MPQEEFKLSTLNLLDHGLIDAAFSQHVKKVMADCADRPTDESAREITIKFTFKPRPDINGSSIDLGGVYVSTDMQSKVPPHKTRVYEMQPKSDNRLAFHPDLPENPADETIMDEADRVARERDQRRGGDGGAA